MHKQSQHALEKNNDEYFQIIGSNHAISAGRRKHLLATNLIHQYFAPKYCSFAFLSSTNEVSTGPTCQKVDVCTSGVCVHFLSFFQGV